MSKTTPVAPERSYRQRIDALKRANDIRSARAQLKREAKARQASVTEVLMAPASEMETMKVFDLLLATPKYGRVKVTKIMRGALTSPSKTVGGLSPRQRVAIAQRMGVAPDVVGAFLARVRERGDG